MLKVLKRMAAKNLKTTTPQPDEITEEEHQQLAIWAADCAEQVLGLFEQNHPEDDRPRKAIAAARAWVSGKIKTSAARQFAFAAHAAAREANSLPAQAAARAAGHAAATAHVASHAKYAVAYAVKASAQTSTEPDWPWRYLPENLKNKTELLPNGNK